ncbi:MAG: LamG domain-containing protein, partial [Planctomycetota bacterium]
NPQWRPLQGQTGGALELDGKGDFISTPFVVNPADGVFSVFAWIKGGAPGQVILSQGNGTSWLCMDSATGNLMTELKEPGRYSGALLSQTVITDGHWHRVGFVWDGADRILYVDDTEVARDVQTGLEGSRGSLYIGVGNTFGSSSFFSGLVDDVRIYNRAVRP